MIYWFKINRNIVGGEGFMQTVCSFRSRERAEKICSQKGIPSDIIHESCDEGWHLESERQSPEYDYIGV